VSPARITSSLALVAVAAWLYQSLPHVTATPSGAHAWRETDGLVVARNYCLEQAPFHQPRVNNRGDSDGQTGLEFPVLNFIVGHLGCATGDFVTPWRILSLLFAGLMAAALWVCGRNLFGVTAGWAAVLALATSPLTPYFSRSAQPDFTAAACATAALAIASNSRTWKSALGAAGSACMAALVKLPTAIYLLPVLAFTVFRERPSLLKLSSRGVMALAAAGSALSWYSHARRLEMLHGLTNFGVTRSPWQLWSEWQMPVFWQRAFLQHPFDVWLFPLWTVLLLAVAVARRKKTPWEVGVLGLTAVAGIFLCGYSLAHHDYYGIILLPALCLMAGWAMSEGLQAIAFQRGRVLLAAGLVVVALTYQMLRARRFWPRDSQAWEVLSRFSREKLGIPGPSRVVVFSDGSPQMFWFTGQHGRFGNPAAPSFDPKDTHAVVDRQRVRQSALLEEQLRRLGCGPVFENPVAFFCQRTHLQQPVE